MLDREVEQRWSVVKESYPGAVVFQEADGLYFVRGCDTTILEKEFGIESGSRWYGFDDVQALGYVQELVERGYCVVRANGFGAAIVRPRHDRRTEVMKHRAKGRFRLLSSSLLFAPGEIERATNTTWMKRHGYEELYQNFATWLTKNDWRSLRSYGELYVYQVADWYEVDAELTSMLESHVMLLAKVALAHECKLPCKLVEPRARRNRREGCATRVVPAGQPPANFGQVRFEDW